MSFGFNNMCKLRQKDIKMLELLGHKDTTLVALELGYDNPNPLYQRLYRLRKKLIEAQNFVNKLRAMEKRNPRLRKFLTSGRIKELNEGKV
jgi:hypothetical protein